jgi:hypothetical protein
MAEDRELRGGPQDGCTVRKSGGTGRLPDVIYVGSRPMSDGYAAWADEPWPRFSAKYARSGESFRFVEYVPM